MVLKEQHQLRKIRKGDIHSFEKLFFSFHPGLLRYAESLVRKNEIAEEIVQDVFYNVWKNRESIRISHTWKSYLFRAVYNNSMMYLRKTRKEFNLEEGFFPEKQESSPDPMQEMELREISAVLAECLSGLPERTREIFQMNRQQGLKYREIAEQLSISVKTVEANMGRALKALKNSVKQYEDQ